MEWVITCNGWSLNMLVIVGWIALALFEPWNFIVGPFGNALSLSTMALFFLWRFPPCAFFPIDFFHHRPKLVSFCLFVFFVCFGFFWFFLVWGGVSSLPKPRATLVTNIAFYGTHHTWLQQLAGLQERCDRFHGRLCWLQKSSSVRLCNPTLALGFVVPNNYMEPHGYGLSTVIQCKIHPPRSCSFKVKVQTQLHAFKFHAHLIFYVPPVLQHNKTQGWRRSLVTTDNIIAHNHLNINGYNTPWLRNLGFRLGDFHSYNLMVFTIKTHPWV